MLRSLVLATTLALPVAASAAPLQWGPVKQDAIDALAEHGYAIPLANVHETYLPDGQLAVYMDDFGSCGSAGCGMSTFIQTTMGWKNTGNWSCGCRLNVKDNLLKIDGDHGWYVDPYYGYFRPVDLKDAGMFWMPKIETDKLWK